MFTDEQKAALAAPLDKRNVKPPAPGKYGEYIEGWHVIAEANRIFGFDAWSRETDEVRCVNEREVMMGRNKDKEGWSVAYTARCRIRVGNVVREGCGAGSGIDADLGMAHESAIKEAETDAMKRALMTFGNPFGLALYDKTKANVALVPDAPEPKLDDSQLSIITTLAQAAGVPIAAILKREAARTLLDIPAASFAGIKESLDLTIQKKAA